MVDKMKVGIQDFFGLPIEEKQKFIQEPGDIEGYGQAFVVSEEQKLDWGDIFFLHTLPPQYRKPHLIPKLPATFRYVFRQELPETNKAVINDNNVFSPVGMRLKLMQQK